MMKAAIMSNILKLNKKVFVITTDCFYYDKKIEYDTGLFFTETVDDAVLAMMSISEDIKAQIKNDWTSSDSVLSECKTFVSVYYKNLGRIVNGALRVAFKISYREAEAIELRTTPPPLPPRGTECEENRIIENGIENRLIENGIENGIENRIVEESLVMSLHLNPKCGLCKKYHDKNAICMIVLEDVIDARDVMEARDVKDFVEESAKDFVEESTKDFVEESAKAVSEDVNNSVSEDAKAVSEDAKTVSEESTNASEDGVSKPNYDALYWKEYPKVIYESQKKDMIIEQEIEQIEFLCRSDAGENVLLYNDYVPDYIYRGDLIIPVELSQNVNLEISHETFEERTTSEEKGEAPEYTGGEDYVPENSEKDYKTSEDEVLVELKRSVKVPRGFFWY